MTRWLNVWKVYHQAIPPDPEQQATIIRALSDRVEQMLDSGVIQEGGVYADGSGGYAIFDDDAGLDNRSNLKCPHGMTPFVISDVRPVLDIHEATAPLQRTFLDVE